MGPIYPILFKFVVEKLTGRTRGPGIFLPKFRLGFASPSQPARPPCGYANTGAMFHYPDFFKVGVSQAGNHDNRVYEDDWGEKWQGLLTRDPDCGTNYDSQANQNFAANLKGKLLLAHGTMDANVPFYSTLLVVDALIAANKDFDLILLPNRTHGFGNEPYMMRRRWDYFVEHLLGAEPPDDYEFAQPTPRRPR